jgi:hypothetical protein
MSEQQKHPSSTNPEKQRQEETGREDPTEVSEVGRSSGDAEDNARSHNTVRGHDEPQNVRRSA